MTSRYHSDAQGCSGPPSLRHADGDTMVSGSGVHTVEGGDSGKGRSIKGETINTGKGRTIKGETNTAGKGRTIKGETITTGKGRSIKGETITTGKGRSIKGETNTTGKGRTIKGETITTGKGRTIKGETITTGKGRSDLHNRHAASAGQAQYYDSANPRAGKSPSEPSATCGSTTQQRSWDGTNTDAMAGQEATSNGDFWSRAFRKPNTTMPSEEDEEQVAQESMVRDFNESSPTRAHTQASNSTERTPRPTMIIVGSTTPQSQHSRALSYDTIGSIWKQRLFGIRADHLVIFLLLFLLAAVAAIAGAVVATPALSSASTKSSEGVDLNDLGRNQTISLTRAPTSVAPQNLAPQPTVLVAPSAAFPTPGTDVPTPGTAVPTPGTAVPTPGTAVPTPGTAVPTPGTADPTPPAPEASILDKPSVMPLTSCAGVVDDFTAVFPVGDRDRNCTWLLNRPAERKRHCVEGRLGYEFCRATCGNCALLPPGETSWPWPKRCGSDTDDSVMFEVEENTDGSCGFLATASSLERLCQPGSPAFTLCRETCRNCGIKPKSSEELQALVLKASPTSQGQLENVLTEQFRALEWIQGRVMDGSIGADVSDGGIVQKWALACFAYSIGWDVQWLQSGNDECVWDGITCNDARIVTAIVLDNRNIRGEFVPELSLLSQLEQLIVSENSMSGDLPSSFGALSKLQVFQMDSNNLGGELPYSIGGMTSLRIWYLERNVNLGGSFPDSVLLLDNLEELVFYYTNISGGLPSGVCDFVGLEELILDCRQVQSDCWTDCFYRCEGDTGIPCTST